MKNKYYLGLGSNLGDREAYLQMALNEIKTFSIITKQSTILETAPWGIQDQPNFLNLVILIESDLYPLEMLKYILEVEKKLGRVRQQKWGSRVIDIDILFANNWMFSTPELIIPHPFILQRDFVLIPMNEIASDYIHPLKKEKISELLLKIKPQ